MEKGTCAILAPVYMRTFSCIGSACEDTCCAGWRIDIDRKTYKKYSKLRHPELKKALSEYLKRNRSASGDHDFAKFKLDEDSCCHFLNEERMCSIQLELGEDYLSNVCSTYPRVMNRVNSVIEKSASVSCPEAARMILLNPDGIEFDELEEQNEFRFLSDEIQLSRSTTLSAKFEDYFWDLRVFTIQLLQNRSYSIEERLIILGLFCEKLQSIIDSGKLEDIQQLIVIYSNKLEQGTLKDSISKIPSSNNIQVHLLTEIAMKRIEAGITNRRFAECFNEFLQGTKITADSTIEQVGENYRIAYNEYYSPFITKHEYLLENYLVNHVFKTLFPFSRDGKVFEQYVMMIVHFSLVKMLLIGMTGFYKESFNLDLFIKLISSFARNVEHSAAYLQKVLEFLKANQYTTIGYMTLLIKN